MCECEFQPRLSPYHDGELDDASRQQVEQHLQQCPSCTAELAGLRDLSASIWAAAAAADGIEPAEMDRVCEAVDRAADQENASLSLMRMAGWLGAIAASVLIVASAWLMDVGADRPDFVTRSGGQLAAVALAPEWERVAMTLRADPQPSLMLMEDSLYSPRMLAAVDLMVNGLRAAE